MFKQLNTLTLLEGGIAVEAEQTDKESHPASSALKLMVAAQDDGQYRRVPRICHQHIASRGTTPPTAAELHL